MPTNPQFTALRFNSPCIFDQLAATTPGLHEPVEVVDPKLVRDTFQGRFPDNFDGRRLPGIYLDSTASTLRPAPIEKIALQSMSVYGNSHSENSVPSAVTTEMVERTHHEALGFVNADPKTHMAVLLGAGATAAINRVALNLFLDPPKKEKRDLVIYSEAEHHANILPWRRHAPRTAIVHVDRETGLIDLNELEGLLRKNAGRVRLVSVTGASNVTGMMPDLKRIAAMVERAGAQLLVDGAQLLAHRPVDLSDLGSAILVGSAHKMYAPGGPGLLVMPKDLSPKIPAHPGGGIVEIVTNYGVTYKAEREEAGTPNLPGDVMFGAAMIMMRKIGMRNVWEHERELTEKLVEGLQGIPGVTLYGDTDLRRTPRVGVVTYNIDGMPHGFTAKALSNYFNQNVRNGCFCANPFVIKLMGFTSEQVREFSKLARQGVPLQKPGMVRVSLGIYNGHEDVDRHVEAVRRLARDRRGIRTRYRVARNGHIVRRDGWRVKTKRLNPLETFSAASTMRVPTLAARAMFVK